MLERDGWFYGRGTTDNKAGAAMLVANFVRLKREGLARPPRHDPRVHRRRGDRRRTASSGCLKNIATLLNAEFALNIDAGGIIVKNGDAVLFTVQASEKIYADYQFEATDVGGHSSLPRRRIRFTTVSGSACAALPIISFR